MRDRFTGEAGAAAVEFALVLPMFILLVLGIAEFSRAYNYSISLSGAAREGARVFALDTADPVTTTREAAPTIEPSSISVACTIDGAPADCSPPLAPACTAGAKGGVQATYEFAYLPALSGMVQFFGGAPLDPITLTGIGVMRCGG